MSERYKKVDGKWVSAEDEDDITQSPPVADADPDVNLPDNGIFSCIVCFLMISESY